MHHISLEVYNAQRCIIPHNLSKCIYVTRPYIQYLGYINRRLCHKVPVTTLPLVLGKGSFPRNMYQSILFQKYMIYVLKPSKWQISRQFCWLHQTGRSLVLSFKNTSLHKQTFLTSTKPVWFHMWNPIVTPWKIEMEPQQWRFGTWFSF